MKTIFFQFSTSLQRVLLNYSFCRPTAYKMALTLLYDAKNFNGKVRDFFDGAVAYCEDEATCRQTLILKVLFQLVV